MRRYNITSRTLLILIVITSVFASPVLVQEKRQARVDVVPVPEDVKTVLGKRIGEHDMGLLWQDLWHFGSVWKDRKPAAVLHPSKKLAPPLADSNRGSMKLYEPPGNTPPARLWSLKELDPGLSAESDAELEGHDLKGKAKVSRRISGTASGVDTVNAAQMELRSAVDPGP